MKDRRNSQRTAHFLDTGAGLADGIRHEQFCFAKSSGHTSGGQDQDIFFDKLLGKVYIAVVMLEFWVVAADNADDSAYFSGLDGVDQRRE